MSSSRRYATFREMKYKKRNAAPRPLFQITPSRPKANVRTENYSATPKSTVDKDSKIEKPLMVETLSPSSSTAVFSLNKTLENNTGAQSASVETNRERAEDEEIADGIHRAYIEYLKRPCDETSLRSRIAQCQRGSTTIEKIGYQLQKSAEYRAKETQFEEFWRHVSQTKRQISVATRKASLVIRYVGIYGTSGIAKAALGYLESLETLTNVFVVFRPCIVQFPSSEEMQDAQYVSDACKRLFDCARTLTVVSDKKQEDQHSRSTEEEEEEEEEAEPDLIILHGDPAHWKYYVQQARKTNPNVVVAGLLVWESDTLPAVWKTHVDSVDLVLVPCLWNAAVVRKSAPNKPVFVWHHFIGKKSSISGRISPMTPAISRICDDHKRKPWRANKRVFLFNGSDDNTGHEITAAHVPDKSVKILCVGQWNARKNIHGAIETYLDTFEGSDDVIFYVKTFLTYSRSDRKLLQWLIGEWKTRQSTLEANKTLPTLVLDLECHSEEYMNGLYEWCDIFFSMARAEGVGLGACTAYSFDKRIVMSSYGGQVDYINTPYWIQWKKKTASFCEDPAEDHTMCRGDQCLYNVCLNKDHCWAEANGTDAALKLFAAYRDTVEERASASSLATTEVHGQHLTKEVTRLPTASAIGQQFISILRTVAMCKEDSSLSSRIGRIFVQ